MGKKLLAYQISGQTVGVDVTTYNSSDLNGNSPMLVILSGETIPDGYVDISTIKYWDEFGLDYSNDYSVVKFAIKEICDDTGWTGLTTNEKSLAIKYYSYPTPTDAVIFLMTNSGMTQQQAEGFVLVSWHKHHLKNIVAYRQRWNYAKLTVLSYISRSDGEDLFNTVKPLIDIYIEVGILGWSYNDNQDGIIDYVYSSHGFTGQGLEENGYQLLRGTWAGFKQELDDVFVKGIYNKYDDLNLDE